MSYTGATIIDESPLLVRLELVTGEELWMPRQKFEAAVLKETEEAAQAACRSKHRHRLDAATAAKVVRMSETGSTYKQIAERFNISVTTVGRAVQRSGKKSDS